LVGAGLVRAGRCRVGRSVAGAALQRLTLCSGCCRPKASRHGCAPLPACLPSGACLPAC
jgi:hypothetical protein